MVTMQNTARWLWLILYINLRYSSEWKFCQNPVIVMLNIGLISNFRGRLYPLRWLSKTFLRPWTEGKEQPAEQCCLPQILNDLNKLGVKVVLAEPVKCTLKTLLCAVSSSSFSFSFILLPEEKIYRISPRIELSTAHYVKVKKSCCSCFYSA